MPLISKTTIDKLRNPELLVQTIQVFVPGLKLRGKNYVGISPFNKSERTPSFTVRADGGCWKCFSTGKGGSNAIHFIMNYKNLSYYESLKYLAELHRINIEYEQ